MKIPLRLSNMQKIGYGSAAVAATGIAINGLGQNTDSTTNTQELTDVINDENTQQLYKNLAQPQQPQPQPQLQDLQGLVFADGTQATQPQPQDSQPQDTQAFFQQATAQNGPPYRNTGVAYFDNKDSLSIADAFLAKELGVNISNINLNANVKSTDVGRAKNELAHLFADSKSLLDGVSHYEKTYNKQKDSYWGANFFASVGRKILDATGGFINLSDHDNEKIASRNIIDSYTLASLNNGGAGKRTVQSVKDAKKGIDNTWKSKEHYYAGVLSGLENATNFMNEKMSFMQNAAVPVSQADTLKLYLLNELKSDLRTAQGGAALGEQFEKNRQALGILNEKGDMGINEALRLIYSKGR